MHEFNFHRPSSLQEAKKLLGAGGEPKLMAGGQTLIPVLKLEMAAPSDVVSLAAISELKGICMDGGSVVIGAATTHAEVATSGDVRSSIPALAKMAEGIGDAQVRNRGTLGGSVAHSDPAADYPAGVLGLGATIQTDKRTVAADDFFTGLFETALEPDEIIVAVHFPKPKKAAYAKFGNPASKYAIVGVFVADTDSGVRVAVTGAGSHVFRHAGLEQALTAQFTPDAVSGVDIDASEFNNDLDADAEYRAHLVRVMTARAVQSAV